LAAEVLRLGVVVADAFAADVEILGLKSRGKP
jgi:hypothetical protein